MVVVAVVVVVMVVVVVVCVCVWMSSRPHPRVIGNSDNSVHLIACGCIDHSLGAWHTHSVDARAMVTTVCTLSLGAWHTHSVDARAMVCMRKIVWTGTTCALCLAAGFTLHLYLMV